MSTPHLFAILDRYPSADGRELRTLPQATDWVEVLADLTGDLDPDWLRQHFRGQFLYSLRQNSLEPCSSGDSEQHRNRLLWAVHRYDLIDIDAGRDLGSSFVDSIPPSKRMISCRGPAIDLVEFQASVRRLLSIPARFYRFIITSTCVHDELVPLLMLRAFGRSDILAYATGETGSWSRLLAPCCGAPAVFGVIDNGSANSKEPTISQLVNDYNYTALPSVKEIYGIIGEPITRSLSPRIHNGAYQSLNQAALYLPFAGSSLADYWQQFVCLRALEPLGVSLRGFTVAAPNKEKILAYAPVTSRLVRRAGSANIAISCRRGWVAGTTDPIGIIGPLRSRGIPLRKKRAAIIGCGGSGRAAAVALARAGAAVTLVNRSEKRGLQVAHRLGIPFVSLSWFRPHGFDIVVNATPVGRVAESTPFAAEELERNSIVIDLVYGNRPTRLVTRAREFGHTVIDGYEVLLAQSCRQFRLMTGKRLPNAIIERVRPGW